MKKIVLYLPLLFASFLGFSQKPFPHLATYELQTKYMGEIPIHYVEELGTVINKTLGSLPESHPLWTNEFGTDDILAMELKFDRNSNKKYYFVFTYGPSADPAFYFYDIEADEYINAAPGTEIYVPGNGYVYSTGHTNSMFNIRKKWKFNGSEFEEVKPDLYYVGLKTKTLQPLTLYSDQELTTQFANLPANYDIEVLVAERPDKFTTTWKYLIKTSFGLVGWTYAKGGQVRPIDIEGIYFNGD
jgi:hypothetical protein